MITKEEILKLVSQYITEKHASKKWEAGKDYVRYAGPYYDDKEYVSAISSLLNEWLVLGEDAIKFEKQFPLLLGKKHGIFVNSGSSANLLMFETIKKYYNLPDGTKVICPVASFPSTISPIFSVNFRPVFIDIELNTLNLDLDQLEEAAKSGARILIFAHVLANPPNMDRVMEIVKKYNLIFLEDTCDALNSTYDGKLLGSFGEMSTCSMYPAHHLCTLGEGGFLTCSNPEQEKIARSFREWSRGCFCVGLKANLSIKGTCGCRFSNWLPDLPDEIFDHKYVYDNNRSYNLKPIEIQASVGLEQIKKLPEITRIRKENYKRLLEIFTPYEKYFILPKATDNTDVNWFAFPLTLKDNIPFKRINFTMYLEKHKIQTRNMFGGNLLFQPGYKNVKWYDKTGNYHMTNTNAKKLFPNATKVTTDTLFLGVSPVITSPQLDYVQEQVVNFFKQYEL